MAERIHAKCGHAMKTISTWSVSQIGCFFVDDGRLAETNFDERADSIEEEVICGECGAMLEGEDLDWFDEAMEEMLHGKATV